MNDSRLVEETERPDDPRTPYRRDRDRILYSAPFARLAEITQVVSPERGYVFHNRLTHSIKVAQIARTIAERFLTDFGSETAALGGIDPDAAEAAGLGHDLGHPPFGHIAEHELNTLVQGAGLPDGFEGNAQSFRILCRLAIGDAWTQQDGEDVPIAGLNLTRLTMAGVLKYPWPFNGNPDKKEKWGFYGTEQPYFDWARNGESGHRRSLVAEVMDWSDDVTYAIHDVLDFYRAGLIPLELVRLTSVPGGSLERDEFLSRMFERRPQWSNSRAVYESALDAVLDLLPFQTSHRFSANERDEQKLYAFATGLISRFVNAIAPAARAAETSVVIGTDARRQVDVLKELVWAYVIQNPDLEVLHVGQRRAIRGVFRVALREAKEGHTAFFTGAFRKRLGTCSAPGEYVRLAADYVAGMTERELLQTFRRLQGVAAD